MQVMQWKAKRLIGAAVLAVLLYFTLHPARYTYKASERIPKTRPSDVWEYIADFSNIVKYNPTVTDFTILSESGNFEHWKYTTQYIEHLSHWPYLENVATADYSIHSNWRKNEYYINSTHTTCFFKGILCLDSESKFNFTLINNINVGATPDTFCEETVTYQCPLIFYYFCRREVAFQRRAIMKNLKDRFYQK